METNLMALEVGQIAAAAWNNSDALSNSNRAAGATFDRVAWMTTEEIMIWGTVSGLNQYIRSGMEGAHTADENACVHSAENRAISAGNALN
jgi:hypothetical protein